jgi:hypothetical protein
MILFRFLFKFCSHGVFFFYGAEYTNVEILRIIFIKYLIIIIII